MPEEVTADLASAFEGASAELAGEAEGQTHEQAVPDAMQTPESTEPTRHVVKVRGQELEVDYDELINGYQRQADYTRSTQELAAERQRLEAAQALWESLHDDPAGTVEAIREHFAEQLNAEPPDERDVRLSTLEAEAEERRQQEVEARVASEIRTLQETFEDDFDGDELLEYALENRIGNLEAAYLHRARRAERASKEQRRTEAKRNAPPVAGGSRASNHAEPDEPINSVRDAVRAALKEHNVNSLI